MNQTSAFRHLRLALLLCLTALGGCAPWGGRGTGAPSPEVDRRELVVLVHGMGRTPFSMRPMRRALEREGYRVVNWGYSSTCCDVATLGARLQARVAAERGGAARVHFVGHSLGNIIVRSALTQGEPPAGVGRIVMLAPPNQGSHEADRTARWLGWLLRPLPELRTDSLSTARSLPIPGGVPIGVISGRRDGKVSVAETHLDGEADHVSVPAAHTFLMYRRDVRRLTVAFLRHGRFDATRECELPAGTLVHRCAA